jgi:DNA-binding SARP family transcriptional activator
VPRAGHAVLAEEEMSRLLMEVLAVRGNIAEALRAYEELRFLLREELGATPSPQIQAVHLRLLKAADAGGSLRR